MPNGCGDCAEWSGSSAGRKFDAADCAASRRHFGRRAGCSLGGTLMRAVQTPPRAKVWQKKNTNRLRPPAVDSERIQRMGPVLLCAAAFLLGYLPGIFAGRGGQTVLGQQLANYYMESERFSVWGTSFFNQMASSFVQLFLVALCGLSVLGTGLLITFFGAKGIFMGFCAANVLAAGGGDALAAYWVNSCLPNLSLLFLALWLAGFASQLSHRLFQSVFLGGAPRGQLEAAARRMGVRCCVAFFASGIFNALCSGISVVLIRTFA